MTEDGHVRAIGLAGSLRQESFNRLLLANAAALSPAGLSIEVFDGLRGIPPFDADEADRGDGPAVAKLRAAVAGADALVIATPEYNYGIPGVLKNALDWVSYPPGRGGMAEKVVALMGASTGILGTARAQFQLRQVLMATRCRVVGHPEVLVARAHTRFDADGRLVDEIAARLVAASLQNLVDLVRADRRDGRDPSPSMG